MVRALLIRGMLAGLLAGLFGFIYSHQFGEPPVETAIAFQSYVEYDLHHNPPETEVVGRPLQSSAGLATGTLVYGAALGGMLALVFAAIYGRIGPLAARGTAALLACLGFTAVYLTPFLKYPANPPSIGDPDTIQFRTGVYVLLIVASICGMILAVSMRRRFVTRFGGWNATLLAGGLYVVLMGFCFAVFPSINEVPQQAIPGVASAVTDADVTFPPTVLWAFRITSLGLQVVMWTTIAVVFGVLAERQLEDAARVPSVTRRVEARAHT